MATPVSALTPSSVVNPDPTNSLKPSVSSPFTVAAPSPTSDGSLVTGTGIEVGAIVGIVIGCIALAAVVVLVLFGIRRSRPNYSYSIPDNETPASSSAHTGLETLSGLTYENNVTWDVATLPTLRFE
jgi:hypothetical protein